MRVTRYTNSVNGVSLPTDCLQMHSKISSDWLPNYITDMRPVLEILKMAGYFADRPRITNEM